MGLNVYMYRYGDSALARAEAAEDVPEWMIEGVGMERIEIHSELYPDHLCKIGYLRSSYNDSGFNRVVENLTGKPGFYYIFGCDYEEYASRPDWSAARTLALQLAAELENSPGYRTFTVPAEAIVRMAGADEHQAIQAVSQEMARQREGLTPESWYSNRNGYFFPREPLAVLAAVPGSSCRGEPVVHLVYESDLSWYVQAAEIAVEMCEWVLAQPEPWRYVLHWRT